MARSLRETDVPKSAASRLLSAPSNEASSPAIMSLGVSALSVEFVAKPHETHRLQSAIPAALTGAFQDVGGFAGCLVMISEQEARLVTVITLWNGNERMKQCGANARWVQKLLVPFLDRCLRVQTLAAYSAPLPVSALEPITRQNSSLEQPAGFVEDDETVCVA